MLISSFLAAIHRWVGSDYLCELNKGTLVQVRQRQCPLRGSQSIMNDYKNSKSQFLPAHPDETTEAESVLSYNTTSYEAWVVVECWLPFRKPAGSKGGNRDKSGKEPHL